MAARKGKKVVRKVKAPSVAELHERIAELQSENNMLRNTEPYWVSLDDIRDKAASGMSRTGPSDARTATSDCKVQARSTPAAESALSALQAALAGLRSEVMDLRSSLELVLCPAPPVGNGSGPALADPVRSPLASMVFARAADADSIADIVRDMRQRLEVGPV